MPEPLGDTELPWLAARAARDPTAPALRWNAHGLSYSELAARVERVAERLTALGIGRGDRVAVLLETSLRLVELVHAVPRCGATLVPLNTRLSPPELMAVVADAEPQLLLYERARSDALAATRTRTPGLRSMDAHEELDAIAPATAPRRAFHPALPHTILYTSGTTGRPKGVILTHANHAASAAASRAHLGVVRGDRWLATLPLHHVGGLAILLRGVLDGVPVELHPRFDAEGVERAIRDDGITLVSLVPTMLQRLLEHACAPFPASLRCALIGGAPLPAALAARARACGIPVVETYGLTEAASQVATAALADARGDRGGVGRPLPGTRLRIAAPDAAGCGEILVRGPTVMAGYFRKPDATAAALRDGWLHTGDIGRCDRDGVLHVLDRRVDLIVTGGENVYPAEVEIVLLAHPTVLEAAVYARADPEWGRCVAAAVVPRAGSAIDVPALRAWCRERLAGYKVPQTITSVVALPRTSASGKVRRLAFADSDAAEATPATRAGR